jgi:para-aminobenzoate synthetase component 1
MAPFSPIFRELVPTPSVLSTFERLMRLPYPILFDSVTAPNPTARYSFAAAAPDHLIRSKGHTVELIDFQNGTIVRKTGKALDYAAAYLRPSRDPSGLDPELPPFWGGLAGFIGYEYGSVLERLPRAQSDDLALPDLVLGVYPWVVAWDHLTNRAWVIGDDKATVDRVSTLVLAEHPDSRQHDDWETRATAIQPRRSPPWPLSFDSTFTRDSYLRAIERIQAYIGAGDIFQANLSQRFTTPCPDTPWSVYQRVRARNPAPFAAYFDFGDAVVVSASPERFLHADVCGHVETRPIKGTRPRVPDNATQDNLNSIKLIQSKKDRAEHVMIVDVLRNDISRVAEYGSVHVPDLFALEQHPTVFHLVSTITGKLRPNVSAADLLHACFPGGSITGAPKIRAMEIIAELEPTTRGPYCGTIAYLSHTGAMDSSIVIRTCIMKDGQAYVSAGGGIVADSIPEDEYTETFDKARAFFDVLGPNLES